MHLFYILSLSAYIYNLLAENNALDHERIELSEEQLDYMYPYYRDAIPREIRTRAQHTYLPDVPEYEEIEYEDIAMTKHVHAIHKKHISTYSMLVIGIGHKSKRIRYCVMEKTERRII